VKLLEIQSSPRGESSDSISLTKSFIEACKSDNTSIVVDTLNVWHERLPAFDYEVDPIVWTKFLRFLDGAAGCPGGGPKAAIHSGLESALGSHPCVALSSYQAPPLYGGHD
jgi:hypothetical protein